MPEVQDIDFFSTVSMKRYISFYISPSVHDMLIIIQQKNYAVTQYLSMHFVNQNEDTYINK
jgi:hypothetical protein